MKESIFDSDSERKYYKWLTTRWKKYVELYPQIPVRNVLGFKELQGLSLSKKALEYLQTTSFDYVVCEKSSAAPIMVIEFDGIGTGFSREGTYILNNSPDNDPYRKLKMETKLKGCLLCNIPMIVASFEEFSYLNESYDLLTVIDILIGQAIEIRYYLKNQSKYINWITQALESKGEEAAEMTSIEIDTILDQVNPIKNKIREITKEFPFWPMQIVFPEEKGNYLKGSFYLRGGIELKSGKCLEQKLMSVNISIRTVGFFRGSMLFAFNTIGEYCLARKVQKELGTDSEKWRKILENTPWT